MRKAEATRELTKSAYKQLGTRYREYIRLVCLGETNEKAAIQAGFDAWTAMRWRTRLNGAHIQMAFSEYMQAVIVPERIAQKVLEGMDAMVVSRVVADKQVHEYVDIDFDMRAKYIEMAAKFCNYERLPETKVENNNATQINVQVHAVGGGATRQSPPILVPRIEDGSTQDAEL